MTDLMTKLIDAGYPKDQMDHHCSDLYVYATPLTRRVISEWCKENNLSWANFVEMFKDNITGKPMYDVTFQYHELA